MKKKRHYNKIEFWRKRSGKTTDDLTTKMGKSKTTIYNWCRNDNQPSIPELFTIAEFFGCSAKDLLSSKDEL